VKLSDIERPINAYAQGLAVAGALKPAACLRALAEFLREFGSLAVADLSVCNPKITGLSKGSQVAKDEQILVSDLLPHLYALEAILAASNASKQASAIRLLVKSVGDDSVYLSSMLNALRRALSRNNSDPRVGDFIERLKAEMGTDTFEQTLGELRSSALKREQVVEIALNVYGGIPKSTSRKAALDFIRKPHDARVNARRGIEALGGRSAA
jgi:hypothetical protein